MADLLLPNSRSEGEAIIRELNVTTPWHVVPNAVDPSRLVLPPIEGERTYALFSGRFEPPKNQLGLIRAMRAAPEIPLVLASLEAALCGAAVVTTDRGFARDYFGDRAFYCDPASSHSIRSAVRRAWAQRSTASGEDAVRALRGHVLDDFIWNPTARATREGYEMLHRGAGSAFGGATGASRN